jgi:hypothetical protein
VDGSVADGSSVGCVGVGAGVEEGLAVPVAEGAGLAVAAGGCVSVVSSAVTVAAAGIVSDIGVSLAQPVNTHSQVTARSRAKNRGFTGGWSAESVLGQA